MNNKLIAVVVGLLVLGVVAYFLMAGQDEMATTNDTTDVTAPVRVTEDDEDPDFLDEMEETREAGDTGDSEEMSSLEVVLTAAENEFGQSGTATLEETAAGLVVTLVLTGYDSAVPQPAHIHVGTCPDVGAVQYPLEPVVDNESVTTLADATLADLEGESPLAINVHKSEEEVSVYTSCGDLVM